MEEKHKLKCDNDMENMEERQVELTDFPYHFTMKRLNLKSIYMEEIHVIE